MEYDGEIFFTGFHILDGIERPLKLFCENSSLAFQQVLNDVEICKPQVPSC